MVINEEKLKSFGIKNMAEKFKTFMLIYSISSWRIKWKNL